MDGFAELYECFRCILTSLVAVQDQAALWQMLNKHSGRSPAVAATIGSRIPPGVVPWIDKPLIDFLRKECHCFFRKRFSLRSSSFSRLSLSSSFILSILLLFQDLFSVLCWIRCTTWRCRPWIHHTLRWYFCRFVLLLYGDWLYLISISVTWISENRIVFPHCNSPYTPMP